MQRDFLTLINDLQNINEGAQDNKMVKEAVIETIKKHNLIESGDVVILGLSGGPDSVCLFNILLELSSVLNFTLHGAHVNHMLRADAAEEDQLFVENLCEANGICSWSTIVDCNKLAEELSMTSEEAGRKARYDFFAEITETLSFEGIDKSRIKIAIAQNRDDQVETVLFRIIRGTGTDGLAGIDYKRINERGNMIIRPLLDAPKSEILDYCEENKLNPRMDHTNEQSIYTRNKIRLELIPYIKENFNQNIAEAIERLSKIAKEDRNFIRQYTLESYQKSLVKKEENEIWLKKEALSNMPPSIRHRIIMMAFAKIGLASDITNTHLNQADELILQGITPQQTDLPKGFLLRVSYDNIVCGKRSEGGRKRQTELPKIIVNTLDIDKYEHRKGVAAFDLGLIEKEYGRSSMDDMVQVRTRKPGDYIKLPGVLGRKKLQDLFVDMKIPSEDRDKIALVCIGPEVLWIPGVLKDGRYTANYKITKDTKKVITVEISQLV